MNAMKHIKYLAIMFLFSNKGEVLCNCTEDQLPLINSKNKVWISNMCSS